MAVEKTNDIYHCTVCGNIVEVLYVGGGNLVCCNKQMEKLEAKTNDQGLEKHVPVITETETGYQIKVGEIEHPMDSDHYITFIELVVDEKIYRQELKPGQKPEAEFLVAKGEKITAREYCNVHGLWKKII